MMETWWRGVCSVIVRMAPVLLLPCGSMVRAQTLSYVVIDVGTLPGAFNSQAFGVNNAGQVAGTSGGRPFVWDSVNGMQELGSLGGGFGDALAINDNGQVVGYSLVDGPCCTDHAVRWSAGLTRDLGTLGGGSSFGTAFNSQGVVVGYSNTDDDPSLTRAFLWDGAMRDLGTLGAPFTDAVYAYGINDSGQVVGGSFEGADVDTLTFRAFLWENGVMRSLGNLGGDFSYASAINNLGQVVGVSETAGGASHAFLWEAGVITDLGALPGFSGVEPYAINNHGRIVGRAGNVFLFGIRAFLYSDGQWIDLNDRIAPDSGWLLLQASAINDAGQIAGWGWFNGQIRGFLLRPISIVADTDRNGVVDDRDLDGRDQWSVQRGAFVPVNAWVTNRLEQLSEATIKQFAPVVIQPVGSLPAGWTVAIRREGNTDIELVSLQPDDLQPGPNPGESLLDPALLARTPLTLYASATKDLGEFPNKADSIARLTLILRNEANETVATDTVALQVAPIILAWNSLRLERLYCTELFPTGVAPNKQSRKTFPKAQWVQDFMELGSSILATNRTTDQVVDLHWRRDDPGVGSEFIDTHLLSESPPHWHLASWANDGNGGNIEVFPPYTNTNNNVFYPFGRVVMGSHTTDSLAFVEAQGLQSPIVLNLNWLAVGHVDEVFSFLDENTALIADPAFAVMYVQFIADVALADQVIRVSESYTNRLPDHALQVLTNAPNFFFSQKSQLQTAVSETDTAFVMADGSYQPGDFLYVGRENVRVTSATTSNNLPVLEVERLQPWGTAIPPSHPAGAIVYKWSTNVMRNAFAGDDGRIETTLWGKTDYTLASELTEALEKPVDFVHIPVAFQGFFRRGKWFYVASTANMVNAVVDNPTIYMTDPGNREFRDLVNVTFQQRAPAYQPHFISEETAWNNYHVLDGELHCGSNAKRTLPVDPWWNHAEFSNWGESQP